MNEIFTTHFWYLIFIIGVVQIVAVISPGPDFAIVVRNSLVYSVRTALWTTYGIAFGVAFHVAYVLLGLTLLQAELPQFLIILKWLAVAYLLWLGVNSFFSGIKLYRINKKVEDYPANGKVDLWHDIKPWQAFRTGLLTNLLNPKVIIYFTSFFAVVIEPELGYLAKFIIGMEVILLTLLWFALVSIVLAKPMIQNFMINWKFLIELIFGMVFILFALLMFFIAV